MVTVKSEHEIQLMREAGLILAEVHMRRGDKGRHDDETGGQAL